MKEDERKEPKCNAKYFISQLQLWILHNADNKVHVIWYKIYFNYELKKSNKLEKLDFMNVKSVGMLQK